MPAIQPLIMPKIIEMKPSFTSSENEIANFVVENAEFVSVNTISEIAKKVGTSEASINRFCKKIGYKGFNAFKIDLVKDNTYNTLRNRNNDNEKVSYANSIAMDYQNLLINTAVKVTEEMVEKTATEITKSKIVYILGLYQSKPAIQEMAMNLSSIGIKTVHYTDPTEIKFAISKITDEDLVIVIYPNLFANDLFIPINQIVENGVKVVAITNYDSPRLNEILFAKFIASTNPYLKISIFLSNNFIFMYICDLILGKLIEQNSEYKKRKISLEGEMNGEVHLYNNYLW